MSTKIEDLKTGKQDYYLASWEDNQLVMEPYCYCGNALDEDYVCNKCNRECDCTFVACYDPQSLSVVEKMIKGNPSFKNFKVSMLDKQV